jgi:periplasmic divalent cation tolerance protein
VLRLYLIEIILDSKAGFLAFWIDMEFRSIYITIKDETEAKNISQILLREKLVACVNYFPVKSIYRWKGDIEEAGEIALIAKTRAELVDKVIARVKQLHSYSVPCVVSWIIDKVNPDYLDWIKESTEPDK